MSVFNLYQLYPYDNILYYVRSVLFPSEILCVNNSSITEHLIRITVFEY